MQMGNEIKNKILNDWQYPEKKIDALLARLEKMDEELQEAFELFSQTGEFSLSPKYFGLNPMEIAKAYPFKPPAVFLCLDWIRRDPVKALDALVEEYKKPLPKSFDPVEYQAFLAKKKEKGS